MPNFTYLIPHAASEELFKATIDSIDRHSPAEKLIVTSAMTGQWPEALWRLWTQCPTDIGVFMDDDCILLKDITPLVELVASGQYDCVAAEGLPPNPRNHPGYFDTNFMIVNIAKFRATFGNEGIYTDMEQATKEIAPGYSIEPFYGISQKLRGSIRPLLVTPTNYGMATNYEDYVLHLWYGAWKHRQAQREIDVYDMEQREKKVLTDYWSNQLQP